MAATDIPASFDFSTLRKTDEKSANAVKNVESNQPLVALIGADSQLDRVAEVLKWHQAKVRNYQFARFASCAELLIHTNTELKRINQSKKAKIEAVKATSVADTDEESTKVGNVAATAKVRNTLAFQGVNSGTSRATTSQETNSKVVIPETDAAGSEVASVMESFTEKTAQKSESAVESAAEKQGLDIAVLVVLVRHGESADQLLREFKTQYPDTRLIILTEAREIDTVAWLTDANALDYLCYLPELKADTFIFGVEKELQHYRQLTSAVSQAELQQAARFTFDLRASNEEIIAHIVDVIDKNMGFQPRIRIPAGTRLTVEGRPVEEVTICLSGTVALQRVSEFGDVIMHHASTGRIIGMLALTRSRLAFFTSTATTEVVGIHLTFEQLNYAIREYREIAPYVAALFIRTLDDRLRRSEDIQIEKVELAQQLAAERENLSQALSNLREAREQLVRQASFASLGELAAGVAHELNNPMAAVQRISEHLSDEVHQLIRSADSRKWVVRTTRALDAALSAHAISTREARAIRSELTDITGDAKIAQRLVLAGIHDRGFAREIANSRSTNFATIELAASIGTGLRNLQTASQRITDLVASLRAYARPDGDPVTDVDLHQTIDDTLLLLSHRLSDVNIVREYGDIPHVVCNPGAISQVWTNLIANAAEAMQDAHAARENGQENHGGIEENRENLQRSRNAAEKKSGLEQKNRNDLRGIHSDAQQLGTITIRTDALAASGENEALVRVQIIDDGPGIAPEIQAKIFEPRFTTKGGQVRFGMGIGLGVCMRIVQEHKGTIDFVSSAAGTAFSVVIPVTGPNSFGPNLSSTLWEGKR